MQYGKWIALFGIKPSYYDRIKGNKRSLKFHPWEHGMDTTQLIIYFRARNIRETLHIMTDGAIRIHVPI